LDISRVKSYISQPCPTRDKLCGTLFRGWQRSPKLKHSPPGFSRITFNIAASRRTLTLIISIPTLIRAPSAARWSPSRPRMLSADYLRTVNGTFNTSAGTFSLSAQSPNHRSYYAGKNKTSKRPSNSTSRLRTSSFRAMPGWTRSRLSDRGTPRLTAVRVTAVLKRCFVHFDV
jgi:hypothetical protein